MAENQLHFYHNFNVALIHCLYSDMVKQSAYIIPKSRKLFVVNQLNKTKGNKSNNQESKSY